MLVDWEVVERLNSIPRATRRKLRTAFVEIATSPHQRSDYREPNPRGIPLDVHLCAGYAIKYRIDFPDPHVKVLDLELAD